MRLDSLAQGVAYLIDFMGIDADEGIKDVTEQWLENNLDSFYGFITDNIGGVQSTENTKEKNLSKGSAYYSRHNQHGYRLGITR